MATRLVACTFVEQIISGSQGSLPARHRETRLEINVILPSTINRCSGLFCTINVIVCLRNECWIFSSFGLQEELCLYLAIPMTKKLSLDTVLYWLIIFLANIGNSELSITE